MKASRRQTIIDIAAALSFAAMFIGVVADAVTYLGGSQANQYAFNLFTFVIGIPACICLSSICERCRPEDYTDEELARKGMTRK